MADIMNRVTQHLLNDIRILEARAERYAQGGMTPLEMSKLCVFSAYTLVRAVESLEEGTDEQKLIAIERIIPSIISRYEIDVPGLPSFMDHMIRDIMISVVIKAVVRVLFKEHYNVQT